MQHTKTLLRAFIMVAVLGIATLALPLAAHAGARVSIGIGVPVVVAPAPVVVAPPPAVVYLAPPVVVAAPPVVYGAPPVLVGGYYGPFYPHWRPPPHCLRRLLSFLASLRPFLVALTGKGFFYFS